MKKEKTKTSNKTNHLEESIPPQDKLKIACMTEILGEKCYPIEFDDFQEFCFEVYDLKISKEIIRKYWQWFKCEVEEIKYHDPNNIIWKEDAAYRKIMDQPYGDIKLLEYAISKLKPKFHPEAEIEEAEYYQKLINLRKIGPFLGEVYVYYNNGDIVVYN